MAAADAFLAMVYESLLDLHAAVVAHCRCIQDHFRSVLESDFVVVVGLGRNHVTLALRERRRLGRECGVGLIDRELERGPVEIGIYLSVVS